MNWPTAWDVRVTDPLAGQYIRWFGLSSSSLSTGVVTYMRPAGKNTRVSIVYWNTNIYVQSTCFDERHANTKVNENNKQHF